MAEPLTRETLAGHLPDLERPLELKGLHGPVTIHRDAWGIPHVYAESEHDAFFGQGFATAQDRLWHMEYDRRRAYGRWSEAVGPAGLESDRLMRRFGIGPAVPAHYQALQEGTRAMLEAYAHGVNAFLQTTDALPVEFEMTGIEPQPWLPLDSLAVFLVRHILMGVWESKVWRARMLFSMGPEKVAAFHPGYEPGQLVIVPPGGTYQGELLNALEELKAGMAHLTFLKHGVSDGSNNWVVGGAKTASGRPMLAGDPHRALDVPNVYYQNQVRCGAFDVIGFSFPGVPGFPHFAHNEEVAWAITHGSADYQDLYVEAFDPDDPTRYRTPEGWATTEYKRETITVKGGPDVELETCRTRHGPIVAGNPRSGTALAFRYTALQAPNGTLDAIRNMMLAKNADALEDSMRTWVDPVNNMVYFDRAGQFGYRTRGELPVRSMANAWLPVRGWEVEHDWRGTVPFEEMPAVRNPETGYAYTANNRIVDERYPHYIGLDFAPGFRAHRINERLKAGKAMTPADMAAVHGDIGSVPGEAWRKLYGRIAPQSREAEQALEVLKAWDCQVTGDSPAPTIFAAFRFAIVRRILEPQLDAKLLADLFGAVDRGANGLLTRTQARLHTLVAQNDTAILPPGESWEGILSGALEDAVHRLRRELGGAPADWAWERQHHTVPEHVLSAQHGDHAALLSPASIPMGGDGDTVQAAGYYAAQDFHARFVSVARYIFDGGDWNESRWVVPLGASGHPGSRHYADQLDLYARNESHPMTYDWERIAAEAESTQHLKPAPGSGGREPLVRRLG